MVAAAAPITVVAANFPLILTVSESVGMPLMVLAATANTLACMAHGLAPNALTSLYLANRAPVMIFPAMNGLMWDHPATQANVECLRRRPQHSILGPDEKGVLACGDEGKGRLLPVPEICEALAEALSPAS